MKRHILVILICLNTYPSYAQLFRGEYTTEWQWNLKRKTNWVNLLKMNLTLPLWDHRGTFEASTIHVAKTDESIIDDWQTFSNIEEENNRAAIAILGYMHEWRECRLFIGIRNVNEDFFTSEITSLFTNSSCGIFPTISASYPIANYPLSGLTIHFDVSKGGWVFKNSLYNGVGYNGWTHHDHPFLIRPKKDGLFNMSQLEYSYHSGHYFAGTAIHSRHFLTDEEGNISSPEESISKTSCAWWIYAEQSIWSAGETCVFCMIQYSENTDRENGCYRYSELGCAYKDRCNQCGLSGQYARFRQDSEYSLEVTWKRLLNKSLALQPTFQYITNGKGRFVLFSTRLCCVF